MFSNLSLERPKKKNLLFLIIQVHFLIIALIWILWSMSRLNQESPSFLALIFSSKNPQQTQIRDEDRSATVIPPVKKPLLPDKK